MKRAHSLFLSIFAIAAVMSLGLLLAGCSSVPEPAAEPSAATSTFANDSVSDAAAPAPEPEPEPAPAPEPEPEPEPEPPAAVGVVVIDPGHQGQGDSSQEPIGPGADETKPRVTDGTAGSYTGIPESEINLQIGLKLRDALEERGVTVIMVRESEDVNISNSERAAIANDANADLFIRLHCDSAGGAPGFLTLVPGVNGWTEDIYAESQNAANIMHPMIVSQVGCGDRGIVERTDLSGFNWCDVPCVLFEMGDMDSYEDDTALADESYQWALANAMADATVAYLNS